MVSDAFGLPRDPETAIHCLVGEWEAAAVMEADVKKYIQRGWEIIHPPVASDIAVLMRRIHRSRCGCGLEWGHDPELMWVL